MLLQFPKVYFGGYAVNPVKLVVETKRESWGSIQVVKYCCHVDMTRNKLTFVGGS